MTAASSDLLATNKQACLDCTTVHDSTYSKCWTWHDDAYKLCLMLSCYVCMSNALLHHAQCTKVIKKQCTRCDQWLVFISMRRCWCLMIIHDD